MAGCLSHQQDGVVITGSVKRPGAPLLRIKSHRFDAMKDCGFSRRASALQSVLTGPELDGLFVVELGPVQGADADQFLYEDYCREHYAG